MSAAKAQRKLQKVVNSLDELGTELEDLAEKGKISDGQFISIEDLILRMEDQLDTVARFLQKVR